MSAAVAATVTAPFTPMFSQWRHGGWYVDNVVYPSGGVGCVSRNYADGKWRIVGDSRPEAFDRHTYRSRDAAARAEKALVDAAWDTERRRVSYSMYRAIADALPVDLAAQSRRYAHLDTTFRVALTDSVADRHSREDQR